MATTKYNIRKGESKILELPIIDENGLAVDVSIPEVLNIIVTLNNNNVNFAKYSLNAGMGTDWGTLTVDVDKVKLLVTREQSKSWNTGFVAATITVETSDPDLTYKVYDFDSKKYGFDSFLQVIDSKNAPYTLIH